MAHNQNFYGEYEWDFCIQNLSVALYLYIQMHVYSFKRLHEKAHGLWFVRHNFYFNNCNKKRTVENS